MLHGTWHVLADAACHPGASQIPEAACPRTRLQRGEEDGITSGGLKSTCAQAQLHTACPYPTQPPSRIHPNTLALERHLNGNIDARQIHEGNEDT